MINRNSINPYSDSPPRLMPTSDSLSHLRTPSAKYSGLYGSQYLQSPSTPGPTDPSTLNRDELVGVGELSTPRWKSPSTLRCGQDSSASPMAFTEASQLTKSAGAGTFTSRRTKSIANSESYGSLLGHDPNGLPVPDLPSSAIVPSTSTMGGTVGRHGSGRIQGPRMRVPSGPAPRAVSGPASGIEPSYSQNQNREDGSGHLTAANLPAHVGLGVRVDDKEFDPMVTPQKQHSTHASQLATGPSFQPLEIGSSSPLHLNPTGNFESPPRPPFSATKSSPAGSPLRSSSSKYSDAVAAQLEALRAKEAGHGRLETHSTQHSKLTTAAERAPVSSASRDSTRDGSNWSGTSYPSSARSAQNETATRPRLLSQNSNDRLGSGVPRRSSKNELRKLQPSSSANHGSSTRREPRISLGGPLNKTSGELSTQGIFKQLGSWNDFSHLPPSPSSASINKFIKESASVHLISPTHSGAERSPDGNTPSVFRLPELQTHDDDSQSQQRASSSKRRKEGEAQSYKDLPQQPRELDQETVNALRKLDGLSKASSSSLKSKPKDRSSSGVDDNGQTRQIETDDLKDRISSTSSTPDKSARRKSTATPSSGHLTRSSISSATGGPPDDHRNYNGNKDGDYPVFVPPVPPLPTDYKSHGNSELVKSPTSQTLTQPSEYAPVKDETAAMPTVELPSGIKHGGKRGISSSASSPILSSNASFQSSDSRSPGLSTFSVFDPHTSEEGGGGRTRKMSKKWSFSSALNLGSMGHKNKAEASTATTSYTDAPGHLDEGPRASQDELMSHGGLRVPVSNSASHTDELGNLAPPASGDLIGTADGRPKPMTKRSTSSGIPFFRRSSSTTTFPAVTSNPAVTPGQGVPGSAAPAQQDQAPQKSPNSDSRKTFLGISSIFKSGNIKKTLQRQASQEQMQTSSSAAHVSGAKHERKGSMSGSLGWTRKRSHVS